MKQRCGVYEIVCAVTKRRYVGSSVRCETRRTQHWTALKKGNHHAIALQEEWNRHSASDFEFLILEECPRDDRTTREQFWINVLKPALNSAQSVFPIGDLPAEVLARRAITTRKRAARITRCPRGHPYDVANTYLNKKGKRICRACNALRVAALRTKETLDERNRRLSENIDRYRKNKAARDAQMLSYRLAHKAEKREYDRLYRQRKREHRATA